jgi:hypothetical protein
MSREAQHKTENAREVETWERLGDHALARGDKAGYRICVGAAVELDRDGTVSSKTMAEAAVWVEAIRRGGSLAGVTRLQHSRHRGLVGAVRPA